MLNVYQCNLKNVITKDFLISYLSDLKYYKFLFRRAKRGKGQNEYLRFRENLLKTQDFLRQSINNVKKEHYRHLLTMRYIYGFKWAKIIEILFKNEPDFELQKDYKYRDKAFYWHRAALKALINTNYEELHASRVLKKIKQLCKAFTGMNKTEKAFITEILALVDN